MNGSGKIWAAVAAVLLVGGGGAAALLYASPGLFSKAETPAAEQKSDLARFAVGPLARLETPATPPSTPDHAFLGPDGAPVVLADFQGRVAVVNLWAMWCAPCRTEMPTLAALARTYAGRGDFVVVPVNVDREPAAVADARRFLDDHRPLVFHGDPAFKLPFVMPGRGRMPQTVLIDRQGRIRAAFSGEADWDGPQARALIDALLAEAA